MRSGKMTYKLIAIESGDKVVLGEWEDLDKALSSRCEWLEFLAEIPEVTDLYVANRTGDSTWGKTTSILSYFRKTGKDIWLDKAKGGGDDLVSKE